MRVEDILREKGSEAFNVLETATLGEAVEVLAQHNIGAVVVLDVHERLVGILSERDIVRKLRNFGEQALSMRVSSCMTPDPHSCTLQATVQEILHQMTDMRIRHMPVIEQGALLGLISIGDVVKRKIAENEVEAAALREYIAS